MFIKIGDAEQITIIKSADVDDAITKKVIEQVKEEVQIAEHKNVPANVDKN